MDIAGVISADRYVEGVVEMMLDATRNFDKPLTAERLFGWHAALFPTERSGLHKIIVGAWRDDSKGPMQVVSGPIGHETVHFEAPKAARLEAEMRKFISWANKKSEIDPVLRAALAQSEHSSQRFYSMSSQIRLERNAYYDILQKTQTATLDVTEWMEWFLGCLDRAIAGTEFSLAGVFRKAKFWENTAEKHINDRQRLLLNQLLDGFEGKLTSTKWTTLAKCSQDTAQRDIQALIDQRILVKDAAGGRSTSYSFAD